MTTASAEFLARSLAEGVLAHYRVERPPVPVRDILLHPPPDLADDLSLTESLPFGDSLWLRLLSKRGVVFVNPALAEPERRVAMAVAMFTGLCASDAGQAAGLPKPPFTDSRLAALFARCLLMPAALLPASWAEMPAEKLAAVFIVPVALAEQRQRELLNGAAGRH